MRMSFQEAKVEENKMPDKIDAIDKLEELTTRLEELTTSRGSLITRKSYVETEQFIVDKNGKIQSFLDSKHLGESMRQHLASIKGEIAEDKEKYRSKFITRLDDEIVKHDVEITKSTNEKIALEVVKAKL